MSSEPIGKRRFATVESIATVKREIERQLTNYVNKQEATQSLKEKKNIHPAVTKIVWERLEQENTDFFKAYDVRNIIKRQIRDFNKFLELQAATLYIACKNGVASTPVSFGSYTGGHYGSPIMHSMNRAEIYPQPLSSVPSQNPSDVPFKDPCGLATKDNISTLLEETNIEVLPAFPLPENNVSNFSSHEHNGIYENSGDDPVLLIEEYDISDYLENDINGVHGVGDFGHG